MSVWRKNTVKRSLDEMTMVRRAVYCAEKLMPTGFILLLSFIYFGCGVKGPPIPPRQPPMPAVADLVYHLTGSAVTLTWHLPGRLPAQQANQAAFGIYRSRTALAEKACGGCPLVFEKVATVPYRHADIHQYPSGTGLDSGYRYVFKVRLETDRGAGTDSNLVQFDLLSDMPSGGPKIP